MCFLPILPQSWDEGFFYVWQYERPTSLLYYISAVALPIVVILACLFPLAPWWMRMAFVYFLMAILTVMLSLIAIRYIIFGAVWTTTGYTLWLFPNMMSEEVSRESSRRSRLLLASCFLA